MLKSLHPITCLIVPLVLALASAGTGEATVSGGGSKKTDCYAEFNGITATGKFMGKPRVDCHDGDPTCDADGKADGQCTFSITVCASVTDPSLPKCTPPSSVTFKNNSASLPLPTGPGCASAAGSVVVPLRHGKKGAKPSKPKRVTLVALGPSKPKADRNLVFLKCLPPGVLLCQNNSQGGPRELDFVVGSSGSDLDNGTTGTSHNFPIPQNSSLKFCLSGCNGTSTPSCQGSGTTGGVASVDSLNGADFGPPLPLFSSNVPVCVVNRFHDPTIQGVVNVQTGVFDATATPILLDSDVYLTNQPPQDVCPICSGSSVGSQGTCDSGPNAGKTCTVEGIVTVNNPPAVVNKRYTLSSGCPPDPAQLKATLKITLPLTGDPSKPSTLAAKAAGSFPCPGQTVHDDCTGTPCNVDCSATKPSRGGVNQLCCANNNNPPTPCFPTSPASGSQAIVRTGSASAPTPAWVPNSTKSSSSTGVLAATFCEAATGSFLIDNTTGLPGPGALLLNGAATFVGNP